MAVVINSNVASMRAQRHACEFTQALGDVHRRLASGLRVEHAWDDAAGLAIATSLNTESIVFAQAGRNISDGISAVTIASAATDELTNILTRVKELAAQAASGNYTNAQRAHLDREVTELTEEYQRIVDTTKFNGLSLLRGSQRLAIEAASNKGSVATIDLAPQDLSLDEMSVITSHNSGTGVLSQTASLAGGNQPYSIELGYIDGDSHLDISAMDQTGVLYTYLGNGNGTFKAARSTDIGLNSWRIVLADVTGDGLLDVVQECEQNTVQIQQGDGSGYFTNFDDFGFISNVQDVTVADVNGDTNNDIIIANAYNDQVLIYWGNGDGSFKPRSTFLLTDGPRVIAIGDLDRNGKPDIGVATAVSNTVTFRLQALNGSFGAETQIGDDESASILFGDVNGDNNLDIVTTGYQQDYVHVFLNNGDATFKAALSFGAGSEAWEMGLADLNYDGRTDIIVSDEGEPKVNVLFGNGDGTFKARVSYALSAGAGEVEIGDLNEDGVLDVVVGSDGAGPVVVLQNGVGLVSETTMSIGDFDLTTQANALDTIDSASACLERVSLCKGIFGAYLSRLETAWRNVSQARESYITARAQITDADIGAETAKELRQRILSLSNSQVMAQANMLPALALELLE